VIPMMPPRARQEMEIVAAVPMRKEGMERPSATTGITVVTAVPMPKRVEKAEAQLRRSAFTRPIKPRRCKSLMVWRGLGTYQ